MMYGWMAGWGGMGWDGEWMDADGSMDGWMDGWTVKRFAA